MKNILLGMAILQSGMKQGDVAAKIGVSDVRLSRIKHGRSTPTKAEIKALVRVLKRPAASLGLEP